jgi:hypothetical protein
MNSLGSGNLGIENKHEGWAQTVWVSGQEAFKGSVVGLCRWAACERNAQGRARAFLLTVIRKVCLKLRYSKESKTLKILGTVNRKLEHIISKSLPMVASTVIRKLLVLQDWDLHCGQQESQQESTYRKFYS